MIQPEEVLGFWFGTISADGRVDSEHSTRWFEKSESTDKEIREKFLEVRSRLKEDVSGDWSANPTSQLAAIIVLDQFSRNMFRGSAEAFTADPMARSITHDMIQNRKDTELLPVQRPFCYMPLMHSEGRDDHHLAKEVFGKLRDVDPDRFSGFYDYELKHAEIIDRFGRYPHRNADLGRIPTEDELNFLKESGSSF